MNRTSCADFIVAIFCLAVAAFIFKGCNEVGQYHHTKDYSGQITEIYSSGAGYRAVIMTDKSGFALPFTVAQANNFKPGDRIACTLVFDGWGNFIEIQEIKKN